MGKRVTVRPPGVPGGEQHERLGSAVEDAGTHARGQRPFALVGSGRGERVGQR